MQKPNLTSKLSYLYLLLIYIFISLPVSALKVAVVDSNRVLQEYSVAQKMLQDLAKAEADLNKKIADKKNLIEQAKAAKKTETEIQMLAEQMRLEIEPEARKLEDDTNKKSDEIEANIKAAIETVAKEGKYDAVMIKEAVLFGGIDVSDEVLKKLK
jgi:Skp family chaperone for outer membrane proteins